MIPFDNREVSELFRGFGMKIIFILVVLLSAGPVTAQVRSNLEIMDSLVTVSVASNPVKSSFSGPVNLVINIPSEYQYFESRIAAAFKNINENITYNNQRSGNFILYSLESVTVEYREAGDNGFFSGRDFSRVINFRYSIVASEGSSGALRTLSYADQISEEDFAGAGSNIYPFTVAGLPEGSSWGYLLEPAIATAASAIVVYLFFSVRNN